MAENSKSPFKQAKKDRKDAEKEAQAANEVQTAREKEGKTTGMNPSLSSQSSLGQTQNLKTSEIVSSTTLKDSNLTGRGSPSAAESTVKDVTAAKDDNVAVALKPQTTSLSNAAIHETCVWQNQTTMRSLQLTLMDLIFQQHDTTQLKLCWILRFSIQ